MSKKDLKLSRDHDPAPSFGFGTFTGRTTDEGGTRGAIIPSLVNKSLTKFNKKKSLSLGFGPKGESDSRKEKALRKSEGVVITLFSMWEGMTRLKGHSETLSAQSSTRSGSLSMIIFCSMGATKRPP